MKPICLILVLFSTVCFVGATSLFDDRQSQDWTFQGDGTGERENLGGDRGFVLSVEGNGKNAGSWFSPDIPFAPGKHYRLRFAARRGEDAWGGLIVSGPTFANHDFQGTDQWRSYSFVFTVPDAVHRAPIRVGQWHLDGTACFDEMCLSEVEPVYKTRNGLHLGNGEKITGNEYTASHEMSAEASNSCRFLDSFTASFNSSRWVFSEGAFVTYAHAVPGVWMESARLELGVNYYQRGRLKVVACAEDREILLGYVGEKKPVSFDLPTQLFPAERVDIRLVGEGDPCSLQVDRYVFKAELSDAPGNLSGSTDFLEVKERSPDFPVEIVDLGDRVPGAQNEIVIHTMKSSDEDVTVTVEIEKETEEFRHRFRIQPKENARYRLPYELFGAGSYTLCIKVHSDEWGEYVALSEFDVSYLHDSSYGYRLSSDDMADIWWCGSTRKVSRLRPVPKDPGRIIEIGAARGEYEPFQLVIRPGRDSQKVSVHVSDLKNPDGGRIDTSNISVRHVEYVYVHHETDSIGTEAYWPDPLPPYKGPFPVSAGRNYPLWITVFVPRGTAAGEYRGTLNVMLDGREHRVPLRVQVYDFEIPERPSIRTAFGFSAGRLKEFHNLETDEQYETVFDLYMQNFAKHRISPYNPTALARIEHDLVGGEDGTLHFQFDFSEFDKAGERYFDDFKFTSLRLPLVGLGGGTFHSRRMGEIAGHVQGSEEHKRLFHEYATTVQEHLRQKGWLDEAYIYWFDEPQPKDYEFVQNTMELIDRHAPDLTRMLTEQPERELFGFVDLWCPILHAYKEELCHERQEKGEEIWWYVCTGPKAPYPGLFIDHHAIEMRMWLWMTYKYDVQGCLVWATNYWSSPTAFPGPEIQDPWEDPMSYVTGYGRPAGHIGYWGNGDGRFIYPPRDWKSGEAMVSGPVDSFRWEMLREGLEDCEYFFALKKLLDDPSIHIAPGDRDRAKELLQVPEEIVTSLTDFTKDPRLLDERKREIGELITEIVEEIE